MSRTSLLGVKPPWGEYGHLTQFKSVSMAEIALRWAVDDVTPTLVEDDRYGDSPPPCGRAGDTWVFGHPTRHRAELRGRATRVASGVWPIEYQHEENQIVPNHRRGRGYIGRYRRKRKAPVTLISVRSRAQTGERVPLVLVPNSSSFPPKGDGPTHLADSALLIVSLSVTVYTQCFFHK